MKDFIELVKKKGNVMDCKSGFSLHDIDSLIKRIDKLGMNREYIIFCSQDFLDDLKSLFEVENPDGVGYYTKKEFGAVDYLSEFGFSRRTYEFVAVVKSIEGAVIVPTKSYKSESRLAKKSTLIVV